MEKQAELKMNNGNIVKVYYDEYCENPRSMFDYTSVIYANCRDYNFDEHHCRELVNKYHVDTIDKMLEKLEKDGYIALEIFGVLHSSIALSTKGKIPNPWYGFDDIIFGIITEKKADIRKEFGVSKITKKLREKIEQRMENEVKELEQYINGEVYSIEVTDKDGKEIDCFGGIIGHEALQETIKEYGDVA